jgi:hypothetical protein
MTITYNPKTGNYYAAEMTRTLAEGRAPKELTLGEFMEYLMGALEPETLEQMSTENARRRLEQ